MRERSERGSKHLLISRFLVSNLVIICIAAASIFSAAVPLMAASGVSDYVLKVSGVNRTNDGFQYRSSVDLGSGGYTLRFDVCSISGSETLILFITENFASSSTMYKSFSFGESWQTIEYTFNIGSGGIEDFSFALFSWINDDNHDYYIKNIYLTASGSDINLLTGTIYPLDFVDIGSVFAPISRDTTKVSNVTLSYVDLNEIVTVVDAEGYVLYTEYTGVDQDTVEFLTSEYFLQAFPGSVISKKQNTLGSHITKLFWCNSVRLNLERYCTYRVTFFLSGHVQNCISGQTVLPNGFGAMSISDNLPEKHSNIGNVFNSSNQLYSELTEANYHQNVTMLDGVVDDCKEDTFIYEYIFSTADGYIDNFNSGTYYVNFLNLDSDWLTEYDVKFVGVNVEAFVDPQAEYYYYLMIQDLNERANELGIISSKSSKAENWSLDKAESIRQDAMSGMRENLDIAKSFISGSTFGARAGSVQAAATAFASLYDLVVSAVPAPLQALIVIIPTLAFIGWVIGRVQ